MHFTSSGSVFLSKSIPLSMQLHTRSTYQVILACIAVLVVRGVIAFPSTKARAKTPGKAHSLSVSPSGLLRTSAAAKQKLRACTMDGADCDGECAFIAETDFCEEACIDPANPEAQEAHMDVGTCEEEGFTVDKGPFEFGIFAEEDNGLPQDRFNRTQCNNPEYVLRGGLCQQFCVQTDRDVADVVKDAFCPDNYRYFLGPGHVKIYTRSRE